MLFVDSKTVKECLPMRECVDLMKETLVAYSRREAAQVLRTAMKIGERKILGVMPAAFSSRGIAGAKILTIFSDNFSQGLPSHQGVVALFETRTGSLEAIVDGEAITGVRTAAVSAAATDALARRDAHVLAVLGSGLQARRHLEAILCVRAIDEVRVWDIDPASAARYAREMGERFAVPVADCRGDVRKAVEGADVICTVTAARQPILFGAHVSPGAHINAVGACSPADRELDTELVKRARLFGDSVESVIHEAGDYLIPLREGAFGSEHLLGEVGAVIDGRLPGRTSQEDVTVFEALGLAVEDLAAANYIVKKIGGEKG